MAMVVPEMDMAETAGGAVSNEVEDPGKMKKISKEVPVLVNKVCFFTLSDFVEDRVRVRSLNIVAFSLIYIYFVLALLKTIPRPEPQVRAVRFATPPPSSWLSGEMGDDLKSFYAGIGSIVNRSQKVFVLDDYGGPMNNVEVEVRVRDFVADGPLPCSKVQMDAMANTAEARRLAKVCQFNVVSYNTGKTDPVGLISLSNFTINGPSGLYSLAPSAGGVDSPQDAVMLVSTPVASIEVVDDSSPELEEVSAPLVTQVGVPLSWQPRILVRDMRGLPVPGRKIIAFANPDPTWPILGPSARTPDYNRRGQKVVELNCPESELSDDSGIAKFTCLGVNSTNVDHVNFVFAESSLVFNPWNDDVYSPRSNYPLVIQSYRYSTYIVPRVKTVQVTTALPNLVVEGQPFNPQPALTVTGSDGAPVAGVTCYAMASIEMGGRNPNWFRRQLVGVKNKDLLDAVAITDSNGVAQFERLRWSVEGNTMDLTLLKYWGVQTSVFSVSFNCDGVDQDTHAWNPSSGSYIQKVEPIASEIRIKRFIRSSAEVSRYLGTSKPDGTDTFIAVVRVVDANGNGIPGKTVDVTYADDGSSYTGNVATELRADSVEPTNDLGFAVVNFQVLTGPSILELIGSYNFRVQFLLDGVRSPLSQWLTARTIGGIKPQVCNLVEPVAAHFYSLTRQALIPVTGYPITITSGDLFLSTDRLKSATSCVTFPSISTPNTSQLTSFQCNESFAASASAPAERRLREETARAHFESTHRRLREKTMPPPKRKLQSADGSMSVVIMPTYSSVTDKWGKVRFEPPMLRAEVLPSSPLPTLREYNENPQTISYTAIMDGPSGDHWVRVAVITTEPSGEQQTCFSRLIPLRVENQIGDIEVSGDGGPGKLYEHEIEAGGYVDISLRILLDPAFVDATNLSLIPDCIHLAANFWDLCSLTYLWMNAPYTYHQALGLIEDPERLQAPLASLYHSISPVQKTSTTNAAGFDPETGTLHLRLQMTLTGIYGDFGIQFSGFGVKSRVFTWRVKPPPGLRLEVVKEPSFGDTRAVPGNLLGIQPIINVTSDSGPVNGLIVTFELEAQSGARFQRMTNVKMFSPFPFQYSLPSGFTGPDGFGISLGAAQDGIAYFDNMGIVDGSGCFRVRFVAEGITTGVVSPTPVCIERVWNYEIVTHPPPSWPLNLELQDFNGTLTVEATPRPGFEVPQLTTYLGGFFVRLLVTSEGGTDVTDDAAFELSQRMMGDTLCLFVENREQLGRCSNLELVQTYPTTIIRFSFLRVNWLRRISTPGKIKLRVSDFSASNGWSQGWPLPDGFAEMTPELQFTTCASTAAFSRELMEASMTSEISAETAATNYEITLAPPNTVSVGSMFLVRVKVTTASGGPVRNARVRAGIKALKSNTPSSTSPDLLQSLAVEGNSLQVMSDENVELDPLTSVRLSNADGVIGFPLTVIRGGSGTYQLQFQPDIPDAKIVLQSSAFKVENTLSINAASSFGQIEVPEFGTRVTVPVSPQFCISSVNGVSLSELQKEGVKLSITLRLKGAQTEKESAAAKMVRDAKNAQVANAKNSANAMAERFSQSANPAMKSAVDVVIASANRKAKGMFSGLSEEFAEACSNTPAMLLQNGDPAFAVNLGNESATGIVGEQAASLADILGMDPVALDPMESLNQFTDILMSAGSNLRPKHSMAVQGEWTLQLSDINPTGGCNYSVNRSLQFSFKEGHRYAFSMSINGVEASQDPFTVVLTPADPIDVAINWLMAGLAAILGGVLLSSNVMKHHWSGLTFALLFTLGLSIALPWMTLHQDALFGAWVWVALANFGLIYIALTWGLTAQFAPCATTFAARRESVFEEYSRRKLVQLLGFEAKAAPKTSTFKRTFFTSFNAEDAFFFPSAFLVANLLSFLSFMYILFQSIQVLNGLEELLQGILNTAVDRSVSFATNINNVFFQTSGADLPDSATAFMYVQIQLMRDWFKKLINSIVIGFTIGVCVAAILSVAALLGGFVHFRQSVLDARRGKFRFRKSDAKLVFATGFIGINISSAIISYILIVGLVTLVALPFTFELTWRVIWGYVPTILVAFVLPAVISFVQMKALKKFLFGGTFIKTRAGASIFHFWQTFLSLPGGVVGAITRFVMGLLGVVVMLPITYGSNAPQMVDDAMLLDKSYRTYIAFVMLYATHNNPIMITAAQRLLAIKATRKAFQEAKKHWTSSRSLLLLILIRFPQLRQYRKHVLKEERELAEMLKKKEKNKADNAVADASVVCIEKLEKKHAAFAEEPWIANAVADVLQQSVQITRRVELMKKYRSILSGLEAGSTAYQETREKLRELCKPQGAAEDDRILGEHDALST